MSETPPPSQGYYPVLRTSTTAIISLIAGIASWVGFPFVGAIVAVVTGHMAKSEVRNNPGQVTGDGLATAGLVLGYGQLALGLCACLVLAALIGLGVISIPFFSSTSY